MIQNDGEQMGIVFVEYTCQEYEDTKANYKKRFFGNAEISDREVQKRINENDGWNTLWFKDKQAMHDYFVAQELAREKAIANRVKCAGLDYIPF